MLFFFKRIPSCVMPAKAGIQNLYGKCNWQPYLANKLLKNLKKYFNNSTAGHQLPLVRRILVFKIESVRNTKQSVFWIASHSKLVITALAFIIFLSYNAYSANEGLSNDNQPIEILSDMLRYIPSQNLAIFTGTVETTQGTMKLYCDIMKVEFYEKESDLKTTSSNKIKKIHVDGNVILITPTEKAESERGEYDEKSSLLYLFDNVKLYQGENLLKGDKLTYNTITGESLLGSNQISKRVTGIFIPKKENDQ